MLTVKYKPTGEVGTIVDNEFDPSIYEQVNQGPVNKLMPNTMAQNKSEMPQNMSFGGLIGNASQDIGGIAQGVTKLPGLAYKLSSAYPMVENIKNLSSGKVPSGMQNPYIDQLKTILGMGKGVVNEANELVGRPLEGGDFLGRAIGRAYNKPVTTALDIYGGVKTAQGIKGALTKPKVPTTVSTIPPEAQVTPTQIAQIDLRTNVPQTTLATKSFLSPFTIPTKIGKYMKPQEVAKYMVDHGVSGSLDDLGGLADTVTGQTGKITELTNTLASSATTPIEISANLLNKAQRAELLNVYGNKLPSIPVEGTTAMTAADALSFQRQLEAIGHQYMRAGTNYLTPNVRYQQLGTAYLDASDDIANALNKVTVDPNALSAIKTPQNVEYLNSLVPGLGDDLLSVKNLSELRSLASPFVKLGQMVEQTMAASQSAFNKLAGNLSEAIPTLGNPLAPIKAGVNYLQNTPEVRTGAASMISNIAKTSGNVAGKVTTGAKTFGELLPQVGLAGSLNAPETTSQTTETPSIISDLATQAQAQVKSPNTVQPKSNSPFTLEQLDQGYFKALQAGDNDAATQIKAMADYQRSIDKTNKAQAISPISLTGEDALNTVEQELGFRDAQGNPVANPTYNKGKFIQEKLTPGTGSLSSAMYAAARNYLNLTSKYPPTPDKIQSTINNLFPTYWDSDVAAKQKLDRLRDSFKQFYYTKPTEETSALPQGE